MFINHSYYFQQPSIQLRFQFYNGLHKSKQIIIHISSARKTIEDATTISSRLGWWSDFWLKYRIHCFELSNLPFIWFLEERTKKMGQKYISERDFFPQLSGCTRQKKFYWKISASTWERSSFSWLFIGFSAELVINYFRRSRELQNQLT